MSFTFTKFNYVTIVNKEDMGRSISQLFDSTVPHKNILYEVLKLANQNKQKLRVNDKRVGEKPHYMFALCC